MEQESQPLKLYAYSGREVGLMVVGSREAIRNLGFQLQASPDFEVNPSPKGWPPEIYSPTVISPYKDLPDFSLSFHVEGDVPSEKLIPHTRSAPSTFVFFAILALALIGLFTTVRWFWHVVF